MPDAINSTGSRTAFKKRLVISVILLNLLVYSIAGLTLYQSRVKYEKQAAVVTRNLTSLLDHYINGEISSIDMALIAVKYEAEGQLAQGGIDKKTLNRYMARLHTYLPSLQSLRMTNSRGDVIYSSSSIMPGARQNIIDRDYFIFERDNPTGDLFIAKPVIGRETKKWVLNIARRINNPDGSFAGTVFGNLTLDHFNDIFSGIDVGKNGAIILCGRDLAVIVRYPQSKALGNVIGNKSVGEEFSDQIKAGEKGATIKVHVRIDNTERLLSYRKISGYPLFIFVALAKDEYLADWRKEVLAQFGLVALFTLVIIFSSRILLTGWLMEKVIEEELRKSKEDLERRVEERTAEVRLINEKLLEELKERNQVEASLRESEWLLSESQKVANIGSYDFDIVNDTWESSQKLDEIFGINGTFRRDLRGWISIVHPGYRERMADYVSSLIANKQRFNREYKIIAQNNREERWVAGFGELKYDESGNATNLIGIIQDITER
jgi:PAS domain-containing protein